MAFEAEIVIRMGGDALLGLGLRLLLLLCLAFLPPFFALGLMLFTIICVAIPLGGLLLGQEYLLECGGMKCKQLHQEASSDLVTHEICTR